MSSTRIRAFSALALTWWNTLSVKIWTLWNLMQFCRACKLEVFSQACLRTAMVIHSRLALISLSPPLFFLHWPIADLLPHYGLMCLPPQLPMGLFLRIFISPPSTRGTRLCPFYMPSISCYYTMYHKLLL